MLYFIAEDSNSAREFWLRVLDIFVGSNNYKEVEVLNKNNEVIHGNLILEEAVDQVIGQATKGDSVFVAFDNIGAPKPTNSITGKKRRFDSGDFVRNTEMKCKLNGVYFYASNYYCFEEVYISYIELERLCRIYNDTPEFADALKYVRNCIQNGNEYFDKSNINVQNIIKISKDAGTNKEHFADALLRQSTRSIKYGFFEIRKKKDGFGECWIESCAALNKNKLKKYDRLDFFCNHCEYKMKNGSTIDKILDLEKNSILGQADISLSEFSKYL